MAKKKAVTKTQFKQAKKTITAYTVQQAKKGAKKAHRNVTSAAKSAAKKVGSKLRGLFK